MALAFTLALFCDWVPPSFLADFMFHPIFCFNSLRLLLLHYYCGHSYFIRFDYFFIQDRVIIQRNPSWKLLLHFPVYRRGFGPGIGLVFIFTPHRFYWLFLTTIWAKKRVDSTLKFVWCIIARINHHPLVRTLVAHISEYTYFFYRHFMIVTSILNSWIVDKCFYHILRFSNWYLSRMWIAKPGWSDC